VRKPVLLLLFLLPVILGNFGRQVFAGEAALLIGVTQYPSLAKEFQLTGPENDVSLIREMLIGRLGFGPESIVTLSEKHGQTDKSLLPTRANITVALEKLVEKTKPGDKVVVYFSGHGSQQPAEEIPRNIEPDGLDEVFFPRDVGIWNGKGPFQIPNSISDNEFRVWLQNIASKPAKLWIIFDCCHSGHMTRSSDGCVERFVPTNELGGVNSGPEISELQIESSVDIAQDGMAIMYACQAGEKAIEMHLPDETGKVFGLLTYALCTAIQNQKQELSYQQLTKEVYRQYVRFGRHQGPTPSVEGAASDKSILGGNRIVDSRIVITEFPVGSGKLSVDAGFLQGVDKKTVLSVHESETNSGNDGALLGYVEVESTSVSHSNVRPIEFNEMKAAKINELDGRSCRVASVDFNDLRLNFKVDEFDQDGNPLADSDRQLLEGCLEKLDRMNSSFVRHVADAENANWLLQLHDNMIFLHPGTGAIKEPDLANYRIGPFANDGRLVKNLESRTREIGKSHNLLRIASEPQLESENNEIHLDIALQVFENREDRIGRPVIGPLVVRPENRIQYVVSNNGLEAIDLTVLEINSQMKLSVHFPTENREYRIQPDEMKRLPRIRITDQSFGREHIVFIAVEERGSGTEFTGLAESEIETFRSSRKGSDSMLDVLLEKSLFGQGVSRVSKAKLPSHRFEVIPLTIKRNSLGQGE
jgi:hypothetical protein